MSELPFKNKVCGQKLWMPRNGRLSDMDFQFAAVSATKLEAETMARRALLSEIWWQQATTIPQDEREIAKRFTLDRQDLDLIMRQNKASNRLGLACVMALLWVRTWWFLPFPSTAKQGRVLLRGAARAVGEGENRLRWEPPARNRAPADVEEGGRKPVWGREGRSPRPPLGQTDFRARWRFYSGEMISPPARGIVTARRRKPTGVPWSCGKAAAE